MTIKTQIGKEKWISTSGFQDVQSVLESANEDTSVKSALFIFVLMTQRTKYRGNQLALANTLGRLSVDSQHANKNKLIDKLKGSAISCKFMESFFFSLFDL